MDIQTSPSVDLLISSVLSEMIDDNGQLKKKAVEAASCCCCCQVQECIQCSCLIFNN